MAMFAVLPLVGIVAHKRSHPGVLPEHAMAAVWPAAFGLATALGSNVVGLWFVIAVERDAVIKGILRQYTLPGGNVDALLIAIVIGNLALTLVAAGRYRIAVKGEPQTRRRSG